MSAAKGLKSSEPLLQEYTPKGWLEITGVPVEQLYQAAEIMGNTKPMAVMWAMGITQHITGVHNVMNLANLQMLLGNMGIPGGGVNPLRGQNNVQGACDMGGLPNTYPAYQPVTSEEARQKFEAAWGVPLSNKVGHNGYRDDPGHSGGQNQGAVYHGRRPDHERSRYQPHPPLPRGM